MGIDIHSFIVKDASNEVVFSEVIDGYRNYSFFSTLQGESVDPLYQNLPVMYLSEDDLPQAIRDTGEADECFGFRKMSLNSFFQWCLETRPWDKCGWVTKKEEFYLRTKNIMPEEVLDTTLNDHMTRPFGEFSFVSFTDKNDPFYYLYNILFNQLSYPDNSHNWNDYSFLYFFDC